jgi:RNase P subunit RPR2
MKSKPPVVVCPGCRKPMARAAEARRSSLKEITYICKSCGTITKRYVR